MSFCGGYLAKRARFSSAEKCECRPVFVAIRSEGEWMTTRVTSAILAKGWTCRAE
eukprot:IDg3465t1